MGEGSVMPLASKRLGSWKLSPTHDKQVQGIVVSGFEHLPAAEALFLRGPGRSEVDPGAWLRTLEEVAPISDADGRDPRAAIIAFTASGLAALGLADTALATFATPFREGMYQEDRLRRLGDRIDGQWQKTVIDGGPLWGGGGDQPPTLDIVHALLLLYEVDAGAAELWAKAVDAKLAPHGVTVVRRLALDLHIDANTGFGREHFGFVDGISQPVPFDDRIGHPAAGVSVLVDGRPAERDPYHGVPLGEILFGHVNSHHEKAPGPLVADDPRAEAADLPTTNVPEGFCDFGINGSYLVVRELKQDVAAFWASMKAGAELIQAHDPTAVHATAAWLAERVVGRSREGHLLCPGGTVKPDPAGDPRNDVRFLTTDPDGYGCPAGSHVRRGNPRDGLAKDASSAETLLDAANSHRILRRGRKYGPKPDPDVPDRLDRGLLFICLNTDIARQFEFVQQTWILNTNFATLFDETDPLIGPKGGFTIQEKPLRRIVEVETFVQMAGGEYFFLPSLSALRYLAGR